MIVFTVALRLCGYSQSVVINNQLYGQPVISSIPGGGSDFDFAATSNTIYLNENSMLGGYFEKVLEVPDGWTITSMSCYKLYGDIKVLLDNGDGVTQVLIITPHYDRFSPTKISVVDGGLFGDAAHPEKYEKVEGDATYMLSDQAFYVSRDTCRTWQTDTSGLNANVIDFAVDTSQNVFVVTAQGLYKQNAAGGAWATLTSFPRSSQGAIYVDRKNRMLIQTQGILSLSTDDGATWHVDSAGIPSQNITLFTDDAFGNLYASTGSFYAGGTNPLYRSTGGTSPWVRIDAGITAITSTDVLINSISGDTVLRAGTSFGEFQSTDFGATWSQTNSGIVASTYYGFVKTPAGRAFASTALGVFAKNLNDTLWSKIYPQQGYESGRSLYVDNSGNLFSCNLSSNYLGLPLISKSTNNGASWQLDTSGSSVVADYEDLFYVDETGTEHSGSGQSNALYTHSPGGVWTIDTTGTSQNGSGVSCMVSDHAGYLYFCGSFAGTFMRRPIAGGTWVLDSAGVPPHSHSFNQLIAGLHGDLYASQDQFNTILHRTNNMWQAMPLPHVRDSIWSTWVSAISVDANGVLYAAFNTIGSLSTSGNGVYYTKNNGATWTYAGLDSIVVTSLTSYGDTTYALTNSSGAFALTTTPGTAVNEGQLPGGNGNIIANAYPNPFNSATAIRYNVPEGYAARVVIYDMLSRMVASSTISSGKENPKTFFWNAEPFPPGAYYYKITLQPLSGNAAAIIESAPLLYFR